MPKCFFFPFLIVFAIYYFAAFDMKIIVILQTHRDIGDIGCGTSNDYV
jgi:hypothetical protein